MMGYIRNSWQLAQASQKGEALTNLLLRRCKGLAVASSLAWAIQTNLLLALLKRDAALHAEVASAIA
jgi:hypothetical protein